ncbi:hypothetical protein QBC38DRAFT_489822 [Podospora fimiseda]|uniref:Uncharacterized protein n=1 Tax=Podospora fimiseda TaxID=252190 RepID=A0AAN7BG61_9PEZI|nr:hypothetical protein QBC38DRAFT_489822 [Podospora fimiseda]
MPPLYLNHLLSRQQAPDFDDSRGDETDNLSGGAIAGIVIGSIAGVLLLIWIIRSCTNLGAPPGRQADPGKPWYGGVRDEYPPRHVGGHRPHSRSRSRHSYHHHSRSRSRGAVMVEMPPQAVVYEGRIASRSPGRVVVPDDSYVVYGRDEVRRSRSRSRGRY